MKRFNFPLLFITTFLAACHSEPASNASQPIPALAGHWSGFHGGQNAFTVRALRNVAEWDAFWQQVERNPPRPLDPAGEMAVVVFLGERRTGGYSVEIVRVRAENQKLVVEYRETTPAPGLMVTQALTSPWAVAIVPRSALPVVAEKIGSVATPRSR